MFRNWGAVALAASLVVSSTSMTFAASDATQAALPPGKAAGVKQAQMVDSTWMWLIGLTALGIGIGFVASGNGNGTSAGSTTSTGL